MLLPPKISKASLRFLDLCEKLLHSAQRLLGREASVWVGTNHVVTEVLGNVAPVDTGIRLEGLGEINLRDFVVLFEASGFAILFEVSGFTIQELGPDNRSRKDVLLFIWSPGGMYPGVPPSGVNVSRQAKPKSMSFRTRSLPLPVKTANFMSPWMIPAAFNAFTPERT